MATNRKATMAKRQRELAQKDRVKERADRRAERRARAQERAASGEVGAGPPIGEPIVPDDTGPAEPTGHTTDVRLPDHAGD